ncbi:N-6 DNA methylase [Pseudomonas sp. BF-B-26]|uniref:N-6 DNA methylase n=1 Tax=Pseudomonas sp. BF-B-26 TaxID=2832400 RepID=UPI001CBCEEDC|nr:N-6 DNA methylase [Pseudomonas sp. BF-B-26]
MSLPIEQQIKALKASIFQITCHQTGGKRAKRDLALSIFIKFNLGVMLNQLVARYRHYGATDLELTEHVFIDDTYICLDSKLFSSINLAALARSAQIYKGVVEALPVFSDVLHSLIEDIWLDDQKGNGLGQYLTPPDLANLIGNLIDVCESDRDKRTQPYVIHDDCSGAGSLTLPGAQREARVGRHRTQLLNLMVNDIDPLMCCAAALQFVSSMVVHEHDLHQLRVICSNALTETKPNSKSMVVIKTPEKVLLNVKLAHDQHMHEKLQLFKHMNSLTNRILNKS